MIETFPNNEQWNLISDRICDITVGVLGARVLHFKANHVYNGKYALCSGMHSD